MNITDRDLIYLIVMKSVNFPFHWLLKLFILLVRDIASFKLNTLTTGIVARSYDLGRNVMAELGQI